MRRHSRLPSRPIARGRSSPGRARNRRWRTCSSISWVAPRTVCNDDVVCNARAARIRRVLASDVGDADQGVHSAQARPRLVRHDHHVPLVQLLLFGYAINTNPRHLPTAVLLQEQSDLGRSILKAIQNTAYFDVTHIVVDETEFDRLLASSAVLFAIEIPANFERAVRRGDRPALLVAVDATDPVAAGSAMAALSTLVQSALRHDRAVPDSEMPPFEIRTHARFNPAATTAFNI